MLEMVCRKGILLHHWWECKLTQPLWKTVWRFLKKKLGIKPPYDPAIPLLGIHPEETKTERDTCIPLFTAALLQEPGHGSNRDAHNRWMDKAAVVHIYNAVLLSHKKGMHLSQFLMRLLYRVKSIRKRNTNIYTNAYIWNLEKWYWRIYLQGNNGETDIENRLMDMGKGEERVRRIERVTWKLILPYVK